MGKESLPEVPTSMSEMLARREPSEQKDDEPDETEKIKERTKHFCFVLFVSANAIAFAHRPGFF